MKMRRKRTSEIFRRRETILLAFAITMFVSANVAVDQLERHQAKADLLEPNSVGVIQEANPVEQLVETIIETYPVPLDTDLQLFVVQECEKVSIAPEVIFAVIQKESSFRAGVVGDNGRSFGLMQIQERWHKERMDKLGVDDLLDPYQNIMVGVDYLGELVNRYEDIDMALMAYNAGASGANKNWWSKGLYTNEYSDEVMEISDSIAKGMVVNVLYG